ncbi:UNKNOWN [Stylonychia lemnae]|uniref:Uncharacterized protein n=1 Tax=Stylonychia lemnae TaxID=5949 RepID=A0A078B0U1_STYLE|nr:UNKNOWN [Stylonychia lemnae]|eukprot:CDW86728.1 UNKNOWN [Stylonychia lemnae]
MSKNQKLDLGVVTGFLKPQVTITDFQAKYSLLWTKERQYFNGTSYKQQNNVFAVIQKYMQWRKLKVIQVQNSWPDNTYVKRLDYFKLQRRQLTPGQEHFVLLYSSECLQSRIVQNVFNKFVKTFPMIKDFIYEEIDVTSEIIQGFHINTYTPQLLLFNKTDLRAPPQKLFSNLVNGSYYKYLKGTSESFREHLILQKENRLNAKSQHYYCGINFCEDIHHNASLAQNYLQNHFVDYDKIVERDALENKELVGYRAIPIGKMDGQEVNFPLFRLVKVNSDGNYEEVKVLRFLKQGYMVVGRMSFMTYPKFVDTLSHSQSNLAYLLQPKTKDLIKLYSAWFHIVRDPDNYIDPKMPRIMLPNSDSEGVFMQKNLSRGLYKIEPLENRIYDIVLVFQDRGKNVEMWNREYKNWTLSLDCINRIIKKTNYTILLIGKSQLPKRLNETGRLFTLPKLSQLEFFQQLSRCKVLFVTGALDASPRVLTQAMFLNVSIVVINSTLGGWHYVNNLTGAFYINQLDFIRIVSETIEKVNHQQLNPRGWYLDFLEQKPKEIQSFISMMRKQNFYDYDDLGNDGSINLHLN